MTASPISYNVVFNKVQSTLSTSIEIRDSKGLRTCFDFKLSESIKYYIETATRDFLLRKIVSGNEADLQKVKTLVEICIDGAKQEMCLPTLPVLILSDAFDCITIGQCEKLFTFVEENVSVWKSDTFFASCKNQFLRMCNDVLRKLSRSQNTDFCGRILLFLARFFPFSERSGLNLISEFNLENVTMFTDADRMDTDNADSSQSSEHKNKTVFNHTLYTKFWALQDFFRSPNQCFKRANWKVFESYSKDVFDAFASFKLDNVQTKRKTPESTSSAKQIEAMQYFAKYLTSQKLLDLQFSDSNFRRYVILQMLILFHYLTSKVKFRAESLAEDQQEWVRQMQAKAYTLLAETPPNGKFFVRVVKKFLKREDSWSDWKNNGCPEIKKPAVNPAEKRISQTDKPVTKKPRCKLGDIVREGDLENRFVMGNSEMTRLWNICPDNMDACRSSKRNFVPTIESYFSTAFQQMEDDITNKNPESVLNKSEFAWRALRLLSHKSPHFFTSCSIIYGVSHYLNDIVAKLHKDLQAQKVGDPKLEEDLDVEKMMALDQSENDKVEDEETADDEDDNVREEDVSLTEDQIRALSVQLNKKGDEAWRKLGKKLDFEPDELDYFVSEGKGRLKAIETMLERWVENEKEEANKSCIIYTLGGLKMEDVSKAAFPN